MIEKFKLENLSEKDRRALKFGAVCAALIIVFLFATSVMDSWSAAKNSHALVKKNLQTIDMQSSKQKGLLSIVPVFEMPKAEDDQKNLFREKFNDQIKKAGLKSQPLQISRAVKSKQPGYKMMRFQYSGKCRFDQVVSLLAGLNENQYLLAIEEIEMKCDPKKRQEMDLTLVVSTFVR